MTSLLTHCCGSRFRLSGEKVWLRPLAEKDATQRYLRWLNNPDVNEYSNRSGQTFNMQDISVFIASANESQERLLLGIFMKKDNQHVGNIQITIIDLNSGVAEISNLIGEQDYWGKGVIKDADTQAIHFGFSALQIQKFAMGNIAPHRASTFKSRILGAKLEGRLRNHTFHKGKLVDVLRFGLLKKEFYAECPHLVKKITWAPQTIGPLISDKPWIGGYDRAN